MAWQQITEEQLKSRLSGPEYDLLSSAALAADQGNPLPEIITEVTDEVRGYIAAQYPLEAGSTLPSKLVGTAVTIIAWRAALRLNVKILLSDSRKNEYEAAIKLLQRVADGKFAVEEPATADTEPQNSAGNSPSMSEKTRIHTHDDEEGI
jgi:phage gp36-like protein